MIHPLADCQSKLIGDGTTIWQFCVILNGAVIGSNCNLCAHVFVENDVIIGNNVTVKSGVQLWDGLRVKDNVFIGANVSFINDLIPRSKVYPSEFLMTTLEEHCSIGANSTIMGGLIIGEYALVGAGSVVTKNVPAHEIWFGNPASKKGYITKDGIALDLNMCDKNGVKHKI